MALLPKDRLGVAVMVNSSRGPLLHVLIANRILDAYLGIASPDPIPAALRSDLFGPIRVQLDRDTLSMQMGEGLMADLIPWHYDTFLVRWRSPRHREDWMTLATFTLDDRANPASFGMILGRDTVVVKRVGGPVSR